MDCTSLATSSACMASSSAAGCRVIPATASLAFFLLSEATRTASPEEPHLDPSKLPKLPSSPLGTRLAAPAARAPSRRAGSAMVEDARPSLLKSNSGIPNSGDAVPKLVMPRGQCGGRRPSWPSLCMRWPVGPGGISPPLPLSVGACLACVWLLVRWCCRVLCTARAHVLPWALGVRALAFGVISKYKHVSRPSSGRVASGSGSGSVGVGVLVLACWQAERTNHTTVQADNRDLSAVAVPGRAILTALFVGHVRMFDVRCSDPPSPSDPSPMMAPCPVTSDSDPVTLGL
eukprot:scaffold3472_cov136-Isochrysis_galbana.AAC.6